MGLGYPPRSDNDDEGPRLVPGRGHLGNKWRGLRSLLIILFLLFDVAGLVLLLFPGVITLTQSATLGSRAILIPTPSDQLPTTLASAPTLAPPTATMPLATVTVFATPNSKGVASTAFPLTRTPSATEAVRAAEGAPGVYVQSVRLDPPVPRRNQDFFFYVTFVNTTGATQTVRWDVLLYRPGNLRQYFGQSLPVGKGDSIAPGTQELRSFGTYKLAGGGGCEQVVIGIGRLEEGQPAKLVNQPDGNPYIQTVTICP